MSKADGGETSSSIASSTSTHKNDRVIIRTGDKVHPEISFHCTSNYRFSDLLGDACRCNVSHSKYSGLVVWGDGLMTIDGNATSIHHNGTNGLHYGLNAGSGSIHLVSPLTEEMI